MPRKPSNPLRNGARTQISRILLALGLILLNATSSYGAANPPVHRLHISFDIAKATMHGTSIVEVPANSSAIYHTPGLAITSIWINDQQIDLMAGPNK